MMGWAIQADGRLDRTHQWQNLNDKVEWERAMLQGAYQERLMDICELCADPATQNAEIRGLLTNPAMPPRVGYIRDEPGITDILHMTQPPSHSLFDYSGTDHSQESSTRPSISGAGAPA
jgi:hypothetical protein